MTHDTQTLFDSLDALLERERSAILNGELTDISPLLEEKEALIAQLTAMDQIEMTELSELRGKALRNQALLDNALQGIRAVANRVNTLRRLRKSFDTYDKSGRKTSIQTQHNGQVEKRA